MVYDKTTFDNKYLGDMMKNENSTSLTLLVITVSIVVSAFPNLAFAGDRPIELMPILKIVVPTIMALIASIVMYNNNRKP